MLDIIFATGNKHKISEVSRVIDQERFNIISLADIGIEEDIPETGDTLEENALIKARYVSARRDSIIFSEDTGLEVTVLDGAPGVMTARYAGNNKSPNDNIDLLLHNLEGARDRSAQFRAVMALIIDGKEVLFEGIIKGKIATQKSGKEGFGYDPIFIPEGYDMTFADLPESVKLGLSHRSKALSKLVAFLESSDIDIN